MPVSDIDDIKTILQAEVIHKKKDLVSDLIQLEEEREEENFLNEIADDYKRYNQFIVQQKEKQVIELTKILDYLDELNETQAVTKYTLDHSKNEQKRVLEEIKLLQSEMDKILNN